MSGVPATFWSGPIRYMKWASYEKPAIFWSVIVGAMGPAALVVVPPMRRWAGDETPKRIPLTYPGEYYTPISQLCKRRECSWGVVMDGGACIESVDGGSSGAVARLMFIMMLDAS